MPELISRISRSAGLASFSSTIRAICSPDPDDAAVAVRVVDDRRDDGGGGAGWCRGDRPALCSVSARQQRHVAGQQDQRAGLRRPARLGRQQGVRGAELWLLHHKREARMPRQRGRERVRLMADDDGGRARVDGGGAASTCSIIGCPATRCSTLGRADFMRVPLPAARMTTWSVHVEEGVRRTHPASSIIAPIGS